MGQVILRAIEVKIRGEWRIIDIPTTRKEYYDHIEDKYMPSIQFNDDFYLNYISEVSLWLRDYVFGSGCDSSLKSISKIPDDISEEMKHTIPNEYVYCINLEDWVPYIKQQEEEFKNMLQDYYFKKFFQTINYKLDGISQNKSYEEINKEIEDKIENREFPDEEDLGYLYDDIWVEKYNLICAINNEYSSIYNLLYDIYETWPECRVYYWLDW